jgi:hypothetical protein
MYKERFGTARTKPESETLPVRKRLEYLKEELPHEKAV